MQYEPAGAIVKPGHPPAVLARRIDEIEEGLGQLREVAGFRRPIVHLGVGADGVLTAPRGRQAIVPFSLEIRRHASRPAAGDQQIRSVLEIEPPVLASLSWLPSPPPRKPRS